jgi:hypothetical protein
MPAPIDRRKFNQLTAAAFSGLAAGTLLGCQNEPTKVASPVAATKSDVHLCRGLNDCKGKGQGGDNSCRGQGACATAKEHTCGGQNECKGLGGCGDTAGANECATKGACHVPLMDDAWKAVRARMEGDWKQKDLAFAEAPAKAGKKSSHQPDAVEQADPSVETK